VQVVFMKPLFLGYTSFHGYLQHGILCISLQLWFKHSDEFLS